MTALRKSGGSYVGYGAVKKRSGGAWVDASTIKKRSGGSWVQVWPQVTLTNQSSDALGATDGQGTSHYRINSSGIVEITAGLGTSYTTAETWLQLGSNTDYEVRATVSSDPNGTLTGTFGSWLSLGTTRTWDNDNLGPGGGVSAASISVEIREVATGAILRTISVNFTSEQT